MAARLQKNPGADIKPYRDYYLKHMWERAEYYNSLAKRVLGRVVKHTILTHFNLLNGLFLSDLIEMFKSKGWRLIDAEEAFTDPVFRAEPKIVPAGESVVWALAKEAGKIPMSLRYPAEDGEYEKGENGQVRVVTLSGVTRRRRAALAAALHNYRRPPRSSNPKNKPAAAEIRIA